MAVAEVTCICKCPVQWIVGSRDKDLGAHFRVVHPEDWVHEEVRTRVADVVRDAEHRAKGKIHPL